jgi:hypothetical protein
MDMYYELAGIYISSKYLLACPLDERAATETKLLISLPLLK